MAVVDWSGDIPDAIKKASDYQVVITRRERMLHYLVNLQRRSFVRKLGQIYCGTAPHPAQPPTFPHAPHPG